MSQQSPKLPRRWIRCPAMGSSVIAGTFVPFKVPLDDSYQNLLTPESYFTPNIFLTCLDEQEIRVGLWIDLTNTDRYYCKSIVENRNIQYEKIKCKKSGECPSEEQVQHFVKTVKQFRKNDANGVVAVHCANGFNCTGFLICAYLHIAQYWNIEAAFALFATKRSPGIYKQDYIDELFKRYSSNPGLPSAPNKPWSRKNKRKSVDDDEASDCKRLRIDNGYQDDDDANCLVDMKGIAKVTDSNVIQYYRSICRAMIPHETETFPGTQPTPLLHSNLELLKQEQYKVSWQADGSRCLLLILNKDEMFFFDRAHRVFQLTGMQFLERRTKLPMCDTLLDGEFVIDNHNGVDYPRYLINDVIYCNNVNVSNEDFEFRLNTIYKEVIFPREEAKRNGIIDRSKESIGVRQKDFLPLKDCFKYLDTKFLYSMTHTFDGLLLQPVYLGYVAGKCDRILKWESSNENAVNFRLIIRPEKDSNKAELCVGQLFLKNEPLPFAEVKLNKSVKRMDGKIIECSYDVKNKRWVLMKERRDKSQPDTSKIALAVLEKISRPVSRTYLLQFITDLYGSS